MIQFPVVVKDPDGNVVARKAKAVSNAHGTTVYVWNPDTHQVDVALELPGELEGAGWRQWRTDGYRFAHDGTCGCGHPLKRWAPPRPIVA